MPTGGALLAMFAAGALAASVNAVAGGGSLVTFPVLVALGLSELSANASNTAAIWLGSLGSALGFWPQLVKTAGHLPRLLPPTLLGTVLGAFLLSYAGAQTFRIVVPGLLLLATLLLAFQPQLKRWTLQKSGVLPTWAGVLLQFLISVYGGYFGAGMGILMLALWSLFIEGDLHQLNALKAWLGLVINLVAGLLFWWQGLLEPVTTATVAAGALLGGYVAARISQRLPQALLRRLIVLLGAGLSVWFTVRALR